MSLEDYTSQVPDKVRTDVLSQARLACYKARDAFHTCLEREAKKKPTEIASVGLLFPSDCQKNREEYVKMCRPAWVKHFDREYCVKKRCRRLLDDQEMMRRVRCRCRSLPPLNPPLALVHLQRDQIVTTD